MLKIASDGNLKNNKKLRKLNKNIEDTFMHLFAYTFHYTNYTERCILYDVLALFSIQ